MAKSRARQALVKTEEDRLAHQLDLGHISTAEYVRELNRLLGTRHSVRNYFKIRFGIIKPNLALIRFAKRIKAYGLTVSILSDNSRGNIAYYRKHFPFSKLAKPEMYSYRYHLTKPNPRFYRLLLKKLDAKPSECLFIDDHIENVRGARRIGMHSIHYISNPQLFRTLRRLF